MAKQRKNPIEIKTSRQDYDVIASLGGSCSAATQLKHRGRRPYSLPLDWTLMYDERTVRILPELFRTRFAGFCQRENMFEFENPGNEYGTHKYHLEDRYTGYRVIHHFTAHPSEKDRYEVERGILLRRVDRLYSRIRESKHVLFVLNTVFPYDPTLLVAVHEAIKEQFPQVDVEIVALQFSADETRVLELLGGNIKVAQIERPLNIVYDNQFTAPEWCWMDRIKLVSLPLPEQLRKKKVLIKWAYKLWRHLGKYLEEHNAGCANMRFYRFEGY